jgi:hypothetical protein
MGEKLTPVKSNEGCGTQRTKLKKSRYTQKCGSESSKIRVMLMRQLFSVNNLLLISLHKYVISGKGHANQYQISMLCSKFNDATLTWANVKQYPNASHSNPFSMIDEQRNDSNMIYKQKVLAFRCSIHL